MGIGRYRLALASPENFRRFGAHHPHSPTRGRSRDGGVLRPRGRLTTVGALHAGSRPVCPAGAVGAVAPPTVSPTGSPSPGAPGAGT